MSNSNNLAVSWSTHEPQLSQNIACPGETFDRIFARNPEVLAQDQPPKVKKVGKKMRILKAVAKVVGKKGKKGKEEKEKGQENGKNKKGVDIPGDGLGINGGAYLLL
jgi:hypothetical protein